LFLETEFDETALTTIDRWEAVMDVPHPAGPSHRATQAETRHVSASNDGAFGLALVLAGLAGWVDAAGIAGSGGLFLSFMSGNTTDLAASLVHADWLKVGLIGAVLLLFVAGVIVGELLESPAGWFGPSLVLGLEGVVIAFGAALQWHGFAVPTLMAPFKPCPLVFAMGLQNATMRRAGGIGIGLTYVTGTLVQFGRAWADIVRGKGGGRRIAEYGALWLSLAVGAGSGAVALSISPLAALSAAAGVAGCLAAATALSRAPARN